MPAGRHPTQHRAATAARLLISGTAIPFFLTGLIVQVEVAFHLFATVVRNVRLAGGTFGPQGVYPRPRLYDRAVMRVPGRVRVSESRQANFRKDLAVEHVRQLVAFIGELLLDVKAVCEGKRQEHCSDDADPCRSAQKECNSRPRCYHGNPGPHRT